MNFKLKIMKKAKLEILTALKGLAVHYDHFEHELEDNKRTSAKKTYHIETENFNITLELDETVIWTDNDWNEFEDLEVLEFTAINSYGKDYGDEFTDEEILEAINY